MAVKNSSKMVKEKTDTVKDLMITRSNYSATHKPYYRSFPISWNYTYTRSRSGTILKKKRRLYLHLYYNDQRATDEKVRFNKQLDLLEEELRKDNRNYKHEKLYGKYFSVAKTPVRGIRIIPKEDVIREK